jgi:predicted porin
MTSLKTSIAALALSLPLAAFAQQAAAPAPLYQIYGTLNVNGQYTEFPKPTRAAAAVSVAGRTGVSVDSSNVGIKGAVDTGQFGLGVVYQCETSAQVDGDAAAFVVCNRNSRLGLSTAFGTLFYGNWDSPYKAAWYGTKADDAFGNTDIYDAAGLMGSPGFKTTSSAGSSAANAPNASATFNVRTANSVSFHSAKFFGAQLKAQYGTNERASNNGSFSGALYSAAVNYDMGPLSLLAAYERHDDWDALNVVGAAAGATNAKNTVDTGVKVGAGYELGSPFGATTIGAVWELLTFGYANTKAPLATGAVKEVTRQAVMVNLKHRTGSHEFRARYEYADGGNCSLNGGGTCKVGVGFGAQNYALGYAYYLTSAAQVYAFWTKIDNQRNATYTFATAGPAAKTNFTAGADPMGFGLGMRYAF